MKASSQYAEVVLLNLGLIITFFVFEIPFSNFLLYILGEVFLICLVIVLLPSIEFLTNKRHQSISRYSITSMQSIVSISMLCVPIIALILLGFILVTLERNAVSGETNLDNMWMNLINYTNVSVIFFFVILSTIKTIIKVVSSSKEFRNKIKSLEQMVLNRVIASTVGIGLPVVLFVLIWIVFLNSDLVNTGTYLSNFFEDINLIIICVSAFALITKVYLVDLRYLPSERRMIESL